MRSSLRVLWGLWHLPMFISVGMTTSQVIIAVAFIAIGNVTYTWFYRRTGGSLLLAVLLHLGAHLDNPMHDVPGTSAPLYILLGAYAVLAVALLVLDRRAFEGRTPQAPGEAEGGRAHRR